MKGAKRGSEGTKKSSKGKKGDIFSVLPIESSVNVASLEPLEDLRSAEVLPPDADGPSVMLYGAVNRKRVWLDTATGVVRRQQIVGGRYAVLVIYTRGPEDQILGFAFDAANAQVTGTVRYRNPVFDAGLEASGFDLAIPPGARIKTLE